MQWVVDNGRDAETRDIGRLRLAAVLLDEKNYDEALKLVGAEHGETFSALYADLKGDILVAKTVDPGWAPLLSCAGAVVLDIGGVMSHGAVVARELGIPCVVNVKAGTEVLQTGTTVTVDGSTGEVLLG